MDIESRIIVAVSAALKKLGIEGVEPTLEHPAELVHGDFSTNVALVAAKKAGRPPAGGPKELAQKIAAGLGEIEGVSKVEIAGPGFINFHLSREFFSESVGAINKAAGEWGRNTSLTKEKIGIEYYQPNFFKALHVGHLVNVMVGESLARLLEFSGATVYRIAYYADIGPHIAKAIWGLKALGIDPETPEDLSRAYEYGSSHYKEDPEAKDAIDEINRKVYEGEDQEVQALFKKGTEISKKQIAALLVRLGISFDKTFFETEGGAVGTKLVEKHLGDIFEKSEGAIVFKGEKYGLHTRVFLTSKGLPVYETKDLGLAQLKLDAFDADRLLYIVDVEQTGYFTVILKVIELVFPQLKGKVKHVAHGRLRLPGGRMSSREGNIISAKEILDELHEAVLPRAGDEKIAEEVGQAAMHYLVLRQSLGSNIVFDKNQALSFEGASGPYLQYAYTRAMSVLRKAEEEKIPAPAGRAPEEVSELERLLYRFPEVVLRAEKEYEPHYVTTFLTELAGAFNSWYAKGKIVDAADETSPYKVALTAAFALTMKNGLWLLGIQAPERM